MTIARLGTGQLPPEERAELEAALRDPARFHSDGREIQHAAVIVPLFLLLPEIVLFQEVFGRRIAEEGLLLALREVLGQLRWGISTLWQTEFLEVAGVVLMPLVMLAVVVYALRTRGRHGYAITSFGVVRIRGNALRVLRHADIAELKSGRREPPRYRVITDELDVVARDGSSITLYGFGVARFQAVIEAYRSRLHPKPG